MLSPQQQQQQKERLETQKKVAHAAVAGSTAHFAITDSIFGNTVIPIIPTAEDFPKKE